MEKSSLAPGTTCFSEILQVALPKIELFHRLRGQAFFACVAIGDLRLEMDIRTIPGVVGTGLFLGMAETVLVGDRGIFRLLEERRRGPADPSSR